MTTRRAIGIGLAVAACVMTFACRLTAAETCSFRLSATNRSVAAGGMSGVVVIVTAPAECDWTAASNDAWITVTSGQSGRGDGQVVFAVAPNSEGAVSRTGTLTIAGHVFAVTEAGCTSSLSPTSRSVPVGGADNMSAAVTAPGGCAWTAVSNDPWITVTNGSAHSGTGPVLFSVAPNYGTTESRTGSLTVAGTTLTVTEAACAFSISPSSRAVPVEGVQNAAVGISASPGCDWTASSNVAWIAVTSGQSHTGNGLMTFSVEPNQANASARTGTLTIATRTFTVTEAGCTFTLGTTRRTVPVRGVEGAVVGVAAPSGCDWTATSNDAWISIASGQSGSGNGQVVYSAAPNHGSTAQRTGTMTIAGRTFTVTEAGCTFTLSAASRSVTAAGIQGSAVTVGAPPGCAWSATSNEAWITISSGESGTGGGQVVFTAAANQGPARAGSITIAGTMFTVNQSGAK